MSSTCGALVYLLTRYAYMHVIGLGVARHEIDQSGGKGNLDL